MIFYERRGTMVYTEPKERPNDAKFICACGNVAMAEALVEKLNALPEYMQQFDEALAIGGDALLEYTEVHEVFNRLQEIVDMKP